MNMFYDEFGDVDPDALDTQREEWAEVNYSSAEWALRDLLVELSGDQEYNWHVVEWIFVRMLSELNSYTIHSLIAKGGCPYFLATCLDQGQADDLPWDDLKCRPVYWPHD
jgi:hypothetical protein